MMPVSAAGRWPRWARIEHLTMLPLPCGGKTRTGSKVCGRASNRPTPSLLILTPVLLPRQRYRA